jgi:rhodanese-related sulfurtransferase
MKHHIGRISIFLVLSAVVSLAAVFLGCAGSSGETPIGSPTLPRWVWSAGDGNYSIIVDRYTHEPIRDVTPEEAFGIIGTSSNTENPVVIDVRAPQEYGEGHIRDAINIDYLSPSFADGLGPFDKTKQYIVYCRTGIRSAGAQITMEEAGFKHVITMTGGISNWEKAGLPVTQ